MHILHSLLSELKEEFVHSRKGEERGAWFIYTLLAIILPFTSSRTSNLLRALKTLFGFVDIRKKRYYTFPLFSTDLSLSVTEIIEYYGARWKIEACFKELKRDIGSADTQNRNPVAVTNHLDLRLPVGKNSDPQACRQRSRPFRLFRCAQTGGAGSIRQKFCYTLSHPGQIAGSISRDRPVADGGMKFFQETLDV